MQPYVIVTLILSFLSGACFVASFFNEESKDSWRIASVILVLVGFFVMLSRRDKKPVARPGEMSPPDEEDDFEVK